MELSDAALVAQIEACTLEKGQLTHRNHVRLAWLYVRAYGHAEAGVSLARAIERYAISVGAVGKFDLGLTMAWLEVIEAALKGSPANTFDEFLAEHPELLEKTLVPWTPATT